MGEKPGGAVRFPGGGLKGQHGNRIRAPLARRSRGEATSHAASLLWAVTGRIARIQKKTRRAAFMRRGFCQERPRSWLAVHSYIVRDVRSHSTSRLDAEFPELSAKTLGFSLSKLSFLLGKLSAGLLGFGAGFLSFGAFNAGQQEIPLRVYPS